MQKLIEILEKYVEWIALALGGFFLLFMVFVYVVGNPVSDTLDGRTVTLKNVDSYIDTEYGKKLEAKLQPSRTPNITVQPYAKLFQQHVAMATTAPVSSGNAPWIAAHVDAGSPAQPLRPTATVPTVPARDLVQKLPAELPAPKWAAASVGRSTVDVPPAIAAGQGAAPVMPVVQSSQEDRLWVTQAFSIDAKELTKALESAAIPKNLTTAFLRVVALREEQLPDGSWGNAKTIEPLALNQVPALPAASDANAQWSYLDWASRASQIVLIPSFYARIDGDYWFAPGQPNPNQAQPIVPVVNTPQPRLPRQQREPREPRGGRMRGGYPAPYDRNRGRQQEMEQPIPGSEEVYVPEPGDYADGMVPPGMMPPGMVAPQLLPASTAIPEGYTVPTGAFVPSELTTNVYCWIHDDTVESNKTYRYKGRYLVKNPVYSYRNLVADPALAQQLTIQSAESGWSDAVTVPPIVRFFVAGGLGFTSNNVKVDVYRWQKGKWNLKSFNVAPGDMIGLEDEGIDYRTGWTLVDLKSDAMNREPVIIADSSGKLSSRSFQSDQGQLGPFKREISWVEPVKAAAAAVTP